jgi:uncharacterized OB-fold protein
MSSAAAASKVVPIRQGLFVKAGGDGRPKLAGSRCKETGAIFWPAERINPITRKAGTLEPVEIDGDGRIFSFTVVARGLPGFASPYAIASITLDAGPTLIAQLTDWQNAELAIGAPVELTIGTIKTEKDGTVVEGPMFRLSRSGASAS